ncbi:hypothetical protein CsatA_007957 [Cannabis sativa]
MGILFMVGLFGQGREETTARPLAELATFYLSFPEAMKTRNYCNKANENRENGKDNKHHYLAMEGVSLIPQEGKLQLPLLRQLGWHGSSIRCQPHRLCLKIHIYLTFATHRHSSCK